MDSESETEFTDDEHLAAHEPKSVLRTRLHIADPRQLASVWIFCIADPKAFMTLVRGTAHKRHPRSLSCGQKCGIFIGYILPTWGSLGLVILPVGSLFRAG